MRFMVMHKTDPKMEAGGPPPADIIQNMGKYVGDAIRAGVFQDGAGLHPSSRRVRVAFAGGKRTVTQGPYAGGNELLASFVMVHAPSIEGAIEIASQLARVLGDVEIEVGPVVEAWDLGIAPRPEDPLQRFLLLRKADRAFEAGAATSPQLQALLDELTAAGVVLSAATLAPSRRGARLGKSRTWTDGPFTEAKELVAGFSIVELPSLADAKRWAEGYAAILGDNEVDIREVAY
jgi:hypothetical protein